MRSLVLLAFASLAVAAPALQVVTPIISQMDGGPPDTAGFPHTPGEIIFFSCRIANYSKTSEQKIHLTYSVQAFDSRGVAIMEVYKNDLNEEVGVQDKDWMPKIATEIALPPLALSGTYKVVVKVEDLVAKATAELPVPFVVKGREVASSDTLVVRNFRFFRGENDTQPVDKAAYRPGSGV